MKYRWIILLGAVVTVLGFTQLQPWQATADEGIEVDPERPAQKSDATIYVLPIRGAIEPALLYVVRRGFREASALGADAIFFPMDTPGGAVNVTEDIVDLIARVEVPTYIFVENNAISAGAIIALASDYIFMAPGSKIGDAMPILMSPGGGFSHFLMPSVRKSCRMWMGWCGGSPNDLDGTSAWPRPWCDRKWS